ncbi:YaeQ family protein [Parahaliea aestuarii]|uniref:YaeQ family protein n=1 Tax=Parahaliea aestuarii TaxID=1852021 RepID=A0A5C9A1B7_9GAMM|nr:YaeQ family protein [Parahaliea aestuarii]TXS94558.1 YaeQ family protein [Parahaliea aestuarii]
MALKPTIYKIQLDLADSDRNIYESESLTLARHPSETIERLCARILAYGLFKAPGLGFTKGLSTNDEPDLWQHSDSGEIEHWIELGQPEPARLRKACGVARKVSVVSYGKSSDTWWKLNCEDMTGLPRLNVLQLPWQQVQVAAELIERNCRLSLAIAGGVLYLDTGNRQVTLEPVVLQSE